MNAFSRCIAACALGLAALTTPATAATINDLFNTGVDGSKATVGTAVNDLHYDLVTVSGTTPARVVPQNGAWVPETLGAGGARWVSARDDTRPGTGTFVYRTEFTVPNDAILSSVVVMGDWASDNDTLDILINNTPTGQSNPTAEFKALKPFVVSGSGLFQHGTNTLDFHVRNFGGPSGLLVANVKGTYVPEPTAVGAALLAIGSVAAAGARARKGSMGD